MTLRYLSVCSGIEAATVAWHPLGWQAVAYSEIEAFPSAVLAHHYPNVPNYGDMTRFQEWPDAAIDVLVGGTPCQSFSVAGLRRGMADPRGNLALVYLALADRYRPQWLVWENVPGVLSSNGGRDFGSFLGGMAELGYGFAYRVLDAQHFGLAQRRKRVFVVGCLGDWRRAAAVLFERHSLSGHPAPRRETRKGTPGGAARSVAIRGRDGTPQAELGDEVANAILTPNGGRAGVGVGAVLAGIPELLCAATGQAGAMGRQDSESETLIPTIGGDFGVTHALRAEGFDASEDGTGRGTPIVPTVAPCLRANNMRNNSDASTEAAALIVQPVAFSCKDHGADSLTVGANQTFGFAGEAIAIQGTLLNRSDTAGPAGSGISAGGVSFTQTKNDVHAVQYGMQVRRLTPRECERLQGFPDDYTLIPWRNREAPDGPRYKALGNSMAVPVMRWIGARISLIHHEREYEAA